MSKSYATVPSACIQAMNGPETRDRDVKLLTPDARELTGRTQRLIALSAAPQKTLSKKCRRRDAGTIKRAKTKRLDADLKQTADCRSLVQRLWTLEDEFPQELREACLAAGDTHSNRVLNRV